MQRLITLVLFSTLMSASVAAQEKQKAQTKRAEALAKASTKALHDSATLALLLAKEALTTADTEPARSALYAAVNQARERAVLRHKAPVIFVDIAPDSKSVATACEDGTATMWPADGGPGVTVDAGAALTSVHFLGRSHILTVTKKTLAIWERGGARVVEMPAARHVATAAGVILWGEDSRVRIVSTKGKDLLKAKVIAAGAGRGEVALYVVQPRGRVLLYNARGRKKTLRADKETTRVVISPNGKLVATFGKGPKIELWSHNGKRLATLMHEGAVEAVAVHDQAQRIFTASSDGTYGFWDKNGKRLKTLTHESPVDMLAFADEGHFAVSLEGGHYISIWSGDNILDLLEVKRWAHAIRRVTPDYVGLGLAVEFADGKFVFLHGDLSVVKARNVLRGKMKSWRWARSTLFLTDTTGAAGLQHWYGRPSVRLRGHGAAITDGCVSPDRTYVATASKDGTARLWSIDPPLPIHHHKTIVTGLAVLETRKRLLTTVWNHYYFRDLDGKVLKHLELPNVIDWEDVGGDRVVLAVRDSNVALLYDTDGNKIADLTHDNPVRGVGASTTGEWILSFSTDGGPARLWDKRGKLRKKLAHPAMIMTAGFLRDGKTLLTVDAQRQLRIWSTGGTVQTEWSVPDRAYSFAESPNADRIAVMSENIKPVQVWTPKGVAVATLEGHMGRVWHIAFETGTGRMLTASADKTARLWSREGMPQRILRHPNEVRTCEFLPDGRGFVTTCKDGSVRHFAPDGSLRALIKAHNRDVWRLAVVEAGTWIATASYDNTVRFWPISRKGLLDVAQGTLCRDFTKAERKKYAALLGK